MSSIAKISSHVIQGVDALHIEIEVDAYKALQPAFHIVGLPDMAVRESANRVRSALSSSGYRLTANKIVINLAPADVKKEGASLDLPMAVGLLAAAGFVPPDKLKEYSIVGELGLDGAVRPVPGALSIAVGAARENFRGIIVPKANAREAGVVQGIETIPVSNLAEVARFLEGEEMILPEKVDRRAIFEANRQYNSDFSEVRGQAHAKRAMEVAAAGGHNILLIGSPGGGKTMLGRRLPSILPDLTLDESLETTKIHSVAGQLGEQQALMATRPFRSPHHTISSAALIGGGSIPRPGEVSLAHNGVLFLDEFAELPRTTLEALRQPLEDGVVTISRSAMTLTFPARFLMCAAMNPCPCGFLLDEQKECTCNQGQIRKYRSRLSGPMMDRIDLHVEVPPVRFDDLRGKGADEEPSATIRERTQAAREIQNRRFAGNGDGRFYNAHMGKKHMKEHCRLSDTCESILENSMRQLGLSARAYDRILKVSRTIADLAGSDTIAPDHLSEAIQYRTLDRDL